jgi:hypothetical protein
MLPFPYPYGFCNPVQTHGKKIDDDNDDDNDDDAEGQLYPYQDIYKQGDQKYSRPVGGGDRRKSPVQAKRNSMT